MTTPPMDESGDPIMGREEYANVLQNAHLIRTLAGNLASHGQIERALAMIVRAESVGSILDPTAFMQNHQKMAEDEKTLRAVLALGKLGS